MRVDGEDGLAEWVVRMELQVDRLFHMIVSEEGLDGLITSECLDGLVDIFDHTWMLHADRLNVGDLVPWSRF